MDIHRRTYLLCLCLLFLAAANPLPQAGLNVEQPVSIWETALNETGSAYEINLAPDGTLWLSDIQAEEIRAYNPSGFLTIYEGLGQVSDARPDSSGMIWYVNQTDTSLNRLDPLSETFQAWQLPDAVNPFGTTIDASNRVWVSDFSQKTIYALTPPNQLCAWDTSILATTGSPYIYFDGSYIWFSDYYDTALLRLNPANSQLTRWYLPSVWDFEPNGLLTDGAGGLWFADLYNASIGRLDLTSPSSPRLLRYPLPAAFGSDPGQSAPVMLARQGGRLHFSVLHPGALGALDPSAAAYSQFTPVHSQETLTPDCQTVTPGSPQAVRVTTSTPAWTQSSAAYTQLAGGWRRLAVDDPDSYLWGLAIHNDTLWAVDNGRQVLLRVAVSSPHEVFLPLVKR